MYMFKEGPYSSWKYPFTDYPVKGYIIKIGVL